MRGANFDTNRIADPTTNRGNFGTNRIVDSTTNRGKFGTNRIADPASDAGLQLRRGTLFKDPLPPREGTWHSVLQGQMCRGCGPVNHGKNFQEQ
jgi:hypothetical protein